MNISTEMIHQLLETRYTYEGNFVLSSGAPSHTYIDCRAAMLENWEIFSIFLRARIPRSIMPVATGTAGALMLGLLGRGWLYNPKEHGIEWSPKPIGGTDVWLLDDVETTGNTMFRMRHACEEAGLSVKEEFILYDRR